MEQKARQRLEGDSELATIGAAVPRMLRLIRLVGRSKGSDSYCALSYEGLIDSSLSIAWRAARRH
jgi:hypothetical protein